ncbi:transposase [Culicoidibacter larvae]|uniref:Transposase n=1 Tax=Culicoidibacter larvae TaxID=2579976 RepID=A0A5R8Q6J8_9FIRM|nr:transposase [Culicoidibacter larvae]TLG70279.1 hypothetical protein FEZ08_11870 [Culicoidibacter larvae]
MGKHIKRTYEFKQMVVEEILAGKSYSYVSKKYNILDGTIANWKKKYLNGTLAIDNRGRTPEPVEDIDILKKSYALLMEIRNKQAE